MIIITITRQPGSPPSTLADDLEALLRQKGSVVRCSDGVRVFPGWPIDYMILEATAPHAKHDPIREGYMHEAATYRAELVRVTKDNTVLRRRIDAARKLFRESADPFDQGCAILSREDDVEYVELG